MVQLIQNKTLQSQGIITFTLESWTRNRAGTLWSTVAHSYSSTTGLVVTRCLVGFTAVMHDVTDTVSFPAAVSNYDLWIRNTEYSFQRNMCVCVCCQIMLHSGIRHGRHTVDVTLDTATASRCRHKAACHTAIVIYDSVSFSHTKAKRTPWKKLHLYQTCLCKHLLFRPWCGCAFLCVSLILFCTKKHKQIHTYEYCVHMLLALLLSFILHSCSLCRWRTEPVCACE